MAFISQVAIFGCAQAYNIRSVNMHSVVESCFLEYGAQVSMCTHEPPVYTHVSEDCSRNGHGVPGMLSFFPCAVLDI